ncbi:MAG: mandelate racemase [Magnetovibrio sp.]|nr:mandelate racemase [Magnetovibrio sp.]
MTTNITSFEVFLLKGPKDTRPHWVSNFIVPTANEVLIRLKTNDGVEGFGLATSYTNADPILHVCKSGISDYLIGANPLTPEKIYQDLFSLTSKKLAYEKGWGREALIRISAAVDIACWDIIGKMAGLPLYQLFGGYRNKIPYYVTCGYYRDGKDLVELRDEIIELKEQGHQGFKAKVGGMELAADIERMEVVRDVIGGSLNLMVDVNRAWDLDTATEAVHALAPLNPLWLEEPLRWADDRRELKLLSQRTKIPLSAGESELTSYGCRSLLEEQAIQILQFDVTMFGGFTEGRKMAALCELNHVKITPHHDCFIHAPLVASSPAGGFVEAFTNPERDPLQAELFVNPPSLIAGQLKLNQAPGLGLTLSEEAITRYGERIS